MQSDERVAAALSALSPQISLFRFALSGSLERARKTLASESGPSHTVVALGDFATGLIDAERFSMISSGSPPLDTVGRAVVERAAEVIESILDGADEEFVVRVQSGGTPAVAVRARMAALGAAFEAAMLVELVRRRSYDPGHHSLPFNGYPFEKWTVAERRLAPPLVVHLDGRDLDAFDFAPLMDGCVRLVLVADEPCTPAPLARLVSPGVFVAQTGDSKVLEQLADFNGPAIVALMSGTEARFVHDPRAGSTMWQRIKVTHMPDAQPRKSLGARSAAQQRDDLAHLKALVEPPVLAPTAAAGAAAEDASDKIAAWLIGQAGLQGGMS
jgi:hypothetical protein